jgi:hypothetical protein
VRETVPTELLSKSSRRRESGGLIAEPSELIIIYFYHYACKYSLRMTRRGSASKQLTTPTASWIPPKYVFPERISCRALPHAPPTPHSPRFDRCCACWLSLAVSPLGRLRRRRRNVADERSKSRSYSTGGIRSEGRRQSGKPTSVRYALLKHRQSTPDDYTSPSMRFPIRHAIGTGFTR